MRAHRRRAATSGLVGNSLDIPGESPFSRSIGHFAQIPVCQGVNPKEWAFHLGVMAVAVGRIIADRPPHRSIRALLRIRLPPRMTGVKALHRIGILPPLHHAGLSRRTLR